MKYVEVYKLDENGNQQVVAVCKLIENKVQCQGEKALVSKLVSKPLILQGDKIKQVSPKDGELFLHALSQTFDSGYYQSSNILEK
jgi:hypothetical protein